MYKCDVSRFEEMYDEYFETVRAELAGGRKRSHWMWFIFPQIRGLGHSDMAIRYALSGLDEAAAFLDAGCGKKMCELIDILLELPADDLVAVFGGIDAVKLRSSMTLFSLARPEETRFRRMLDKYFAGRMDERTLEIVGKEENPLATGERPRAFRGESTPETPVVSGSAGEAPTEADRLKGMLWGLVVGDCLGSPIQFAGKDDHMHITDMVPCRYFGTPAGYWTDDSSMAFCIMESAVRLERYDLKDIARNFVRWYDDGFCSSLSHAFDIGFATHDAIRRIKAGSLCNGEEDSQGNGSIMRFAPSYILNLGAHDRRIMHEISDLTHNSSRVRETVDLMAKICDEHLRGERTGVRSIYVTRAEVDNSGWAVSTLQAALWAFQSTRSFEEGLIAAVNLGGDADSIGAVFGQIAGAYYGFGAIPERWLAAVKTREKVDELIESFLHVCRKKR